MAVHGPIFFFDNGEALFQRRKRKLLSLVENLDEDGKSSKPEDGTTEKDGPECETRASGIISKDVTKENNQILYHQDLIAKIEEDAKFFIDGDSTDTLPSLHKFLPLLKQAILTFDELNFSEKVKKTVHDKYHEMRPLSNGIFEELAAIFEQEEIFSPDVASPEIKVVLFSTSNQLIQDTEIEYREWQMGHAPQAATGKLASQNLSSELTFSFDGSRSGKSRFSRKQRTLLSGAEDEGGTSSRSNEGNTGRRKESARRRNMVSDQSDIIEDLYLEQHSEAGSKYSGKDKGNRKGKNGLDNLYESVHAHNLSTTINFSMISQDCAQRGWITMKHEDSLKDKSLVKYLLERLQKCKVQKKSEEKKLLAQKYPSLLKFYGEQDKENYRTRKPFSWSARHKVGFVTEVPQDEKQQFIFSFPDGSLTLYYPNGMLCCVISSTSSPKEQECTRTINVYHPEDTNFIIASFNPSGCGSCWYAKGIPAFLSTLLGCCIYNESGFASKSWSWNSNDMEDFMMPLNDFITLYYTAAGEIFLHLQLAEECVLIGVKSVRPIVDDPITSPSLLSSMVFKSQTAQIILNAPKTTRGRRRLRQKRISSTRVTDDSETEELLYPHKHSIADATDRYLINTRKKALKAVDELLLHLRQEMSLAKPSQPRASPSIKHTRFISTPDKTSSSASDNAIVKPPQGFKLIGAPCCKKKHCITINLNHSPFIVFPEKSPKTWRAQRSKPLSSTSSVPQHNIACPIAFRYWLQNSEEIFCRCDWRSVPQLTDFEYDQFLNEDSVSHQLVVVSVFSSKYPEATPCDGMMDDLYYGINYSRSQPCTQATSDNYRLLRYDISHNSLLISRHNAIPGMFFMYSRGKLLFADLVFNGYGNAKKDFLKQVFKCCRLADQNKFIPPDFKFNRIRSWVEADETVRQLLSMQFGKSSGWIAPKLTPLTKREDLKRINLVSP